MFDPLDLYECYQKDIPTDTDIQYSIKHEQNIESKDSAETQTTTDGGDLDNDDIIAPLYVLDLPMVAYASPQVILATLYLLKPATQVNFKSSKSVSTEEICESKGLDQDLRESIVDWYRNIFPNNKANTIEKICNKIPLLANVSETERSSLLNYYTSILKKYENSTNSSSLKTDIVREVSLRIAECCGRSAIPSMSRDFTFDNMANKISLFEPSLTNDNLGWKTWGASLILSEILVENFNKMPNFKPNQDGRPLNVLELGAGTGLVGISWACKWKEEYGDDNSDINMYVTDLPEIVENLKQNVVNNKIDSFVTADVLDWTNPTDFVEKYNVQDRSFDIILVADPIYSPNHPEWVVNMVSKFLKDDGICYIEIPIRSKYAKERQILIELLNDHGFKITADRYDQGMDDWGSVKYLYREISRK